MLVGELLAQVLPDSRITFVMAPIFESLFSEHSTSITLNVMSAHLVFLFSLPNYHLNLSKKLCCLTRTVFKNTSCSFKKSITMKTNSLHSEAIIFLSTNSDIALNSATWLSSFKQLVDHVFGISPFVFSWCEALGVTVFRSSLEYASCP